MNAQIQQNDVKLFKEPEDMHPLDVIAALGKVGWTLESLAASHFLKSGGTFSKCLYNPAPTAEKRIAEALGKEPKEIWPSRYDQYGNPKPRGLRANSRLRLSSVK